MGIASTPTQEGRCVATATRNRAMVTVPRERKPTGTGAAGMVESVTTLGTIPRRRGWQKGRRLSQEHREAISRGMRSSAHVREAQQAWRRRERANGLAETEQ
jgi:hypothetical protein